MFRRSVVVVSKQTGKPARFQLRASAGIWLARKDRLRQNETSSGHQPSQSTDHPQTVFQSRRNDRILLMQPNFDVVEFLARVPCRSKKQ